MHWGIALLKDEEPAWDPMYGRQELW